MPAESEAAVAREFAKAVMSVRKELRVALTARAAHPRDDDGDLKRAAAAAARYLWELQVQADAMAGRLDREQDEPEPPRERIPTVPVRRG